MEDWDLMSTEIIECKACPEGHNRITWHSLGMICARCNKHTGNNHQGHYWKFCNVLADKAREKGLDPWKNGMAEDFHFCCPDDCELENNG